MFSRNFNLVLRISPQRVISQFTAKNSTATAADKDPAPYFFSEEVQNLLKTVTRPDPDIVFRRQLDGRKLEAPQYKFMTDEQLDKALFEADIEMWHRLQMPPVVNIRREQNQILSDDPALEGYSEHKYVFTDISFGIKNKDRIIAVREPNGILRKATNNERDRLNQVYFPAYGREMQMPKMFEEPHFGAVLERGDYDFILNRACTQFDPDHEEYHRITRITYEYINEKMHFNTLRSTRHFGPMVFYFAWNKKIDNLLFENIVMGRIEDAALLIKLYYILNPSDAKKESDPIKLIQHYIENDASMRQKLEGTLAVYLELEEERRKVQESIEITDGIAKSNDKEIKT